METKYWFILKSSVFVWIKKDICYFYDSETYRGCHWRLETQAVRDFVHRIADIDNLYALQMAAEELKEEDMKPLVEKLVQMNMACVVDSSQIAGRPVQLPPVLNLQADVHRLQEDKTDMTIGENVLKNLQSLTFLLDSETDSAWYEKVTRLLAVLESHSLLEIVILGYAPNMPWEDAFIEQLKKMSCVIRFVLNLDATTVESIKQLKSMGLPHILFDIKVEPHKAGTTIESCIDEAGGMPLKINLCIYGAEDIAWAEKLTTRLNQFEFRISPCYNGKNLDFFEQYVYVDEEDILASHQTKQNIFAHQALNTNDFGKLTIKSNGKVYANVYQAPIGSIDEDIRSLVYKEMSEGSSWLRLRDMQPCSDCVFQWLCPSPSDYELEIGRPDLCHVK